VCLGFSASESDKVLIRVALETVVLELALTLDSASQTPFDSEVQSTTGSTSVTSPRRCFYTTSVEYRQCNHITLAGVP
jgi:hypothetical protein